MPLNSTTPGISRHASLRGRDIMTATKLATKPLFNSEDPLIDMTFITTYTGLTDKWFYKLIKEKKFPKPIKLGRASRWFKSEVEKWLKERIEESRGEDQSEDK